MDKVRCGQFPAPSQCFAALLVRNGVVVVAAVEVDDGR